MKHLLALCLVMSWWWLNVGYGQMHRYGPYLERAACEYQAAQYTARGWTAFCTEERH